MFNFSLLFLSLFKLIFDTFLLFALQTATKGKGLGVEVGVSKGI